MDATAGYSRTRYIIHIAMAVIGWYVVSMCLTMLNKILFVKLGFNYPISVTMLHTTIMSICLHVCFMFLFHSFISFVALLHYPILHHLFFGNHFSHVCCIQIITKVLLFFSGGVLRFGDCIVQ